jgi:hypothetical protein
MSRTGMSRVQLMEVWELMRVSQQSRIERDWLEDETDSFFGKPNVPQSTYEREDQVTFPRFLRSIRGDDPPSAEQEAAWEASWAQHGAAVAAAWHSDQPREEEHTMQILTTWTEEVRHQTAVGLNPDNVEAAGLDPTSADDVLMYLRDHMDPAEFKAQLPASALYGDVVSTGPIWFASVDEIDMKTGLEATA